MADVEVYICPLTNLLSNRYTLLYSCKTTRIDHTVRLHAK